MTAHGATGWWDVLGRLTVIDLAHELHRGMPVSPNHPAFDLALQRRHGDIVRADGGSSANELIVTGGHVGTHVDAPAHISQDGLLHDGTPAADVQTNRGFTRLGIDEFAPMVGRGVLLDVAATHGLDVLPPGYEVTAADLEAAEAAAGVEVRPGDAALIRTGWSALWPEREFVGAEDGAPGPGPDAARWLAERRVRVAGGETIAFETVRPGTGHSVLPVHRVLLVEHGINIVEVMDLRPIAAAGVHEFGFVLAPLKIRGATGSPVRPLALVPGRAAPEGDVDR
ncbi:cyclase family protein [Jiangella asiatica]|uniref:Cyclase family protein n=1 Tax=Jiangella asiatica TaxID=2530372 RepID=A0A4R5DA46_9ACTN|nr:cyclase family protein [Jiangella asiatica]TDE07435.1 cyclase family protein [Jiangella asiatica]